MSDNDYYSMYGYETPVGDDYYRTYGYESPGPYETYTPTSHYPPEQKKEETFDWGSLTKPLLGIGTNLLGTWLQSRGQAKAAKSLARQSTQRELQPWGAGAAGELGEVGGVLRRLAEAEFAKPPLSEAQQTYYSVMAPKIAALGPQAFDLGQEALVSQLIGGGFPSRMYAEAKLPYDLLNKATMRALAKKAADTYGPWMGRAGSVDQILLEMEAQRQADLATRMSQLAQQFAPFEAAIPGVQQAALSRLLALPTEAMGPILSALGIPRTAEQAALDRYLAMLGTGADVQKILLQTALTSPMVTTKSGVPSTTDLILSSLGKGLTEAGTGSLLATLKALGMA